MNTVQNKLKWPSAKWRDNLKGTISVRLRFLLSIVILTLVMTSQNILGQGVGISEVNITPDISAILELRSVQRGLLVPRMSTLQRLAIASPAQGLLVYDTTTKTFFVYDAGWKAIAAEALGTSNQLLGMNTAGSANEYKTLSGTSNQVNVSFAPGIITLSTPQDIHTGASPVFVDMTLSGLTPNTGVYTNGANLLTSTPPTTGILGYWQRSGTTLSPTTAGDAVTTTGNISATGTGAVSSAGLLTGTAGTIISGGAINLNAGSNFITNINTGLSTGNVSIGGSGNSVYLPKFTSAGVVHNDATGLLTSGLIVNNDITNGTIDLTSKVTGVLKIVNGGTNSGSALSGESIMISDGTSIVQGDKGTTTTLLHGNIAGAPAYSQVVDADIAAGTIDLTSKVTNILPVANGGTGYNATYSNGQLLIGNAAGGLTRNPITGNINQVIVTNGDGTIALSTPQDINLTSSPTFAGLTLTGLTANAGVYTDAANKLTSTPPTTGILGYWQRLGTTLSPTTAGDAVTTTGNISATGTGAVSSAGLLTGTAGTIISGGAINLNAGSNFITNINTGLSTGNVSIGGSGNSVYLPKFTSAGVVHNDVTGLLTSSLIAGNDITNGTIDLTSKVTGILPIANGGTNSGSALSGESIMISDGISIVQGDKGTTTTVLHGNLAGAPAYSQVVNADIAAGTIDLTSKVTNVLPVANGGTSYNATYTSGQLLIGNAAGGLTRNLLTGNVNQVIVTNGDGTIALSTPQDINLTSSPTFAGLTISGLSADAGVYTDAAKKLTSTPPSTGILGYWTRTLTTLSPTNPGDAITTTGNISTTAGGTITSSGLLTGSAGAIISGGAVNLNAGSNFITNINTGLSTGNVSIGGSGNSVYLPKFTSAGIVHNDVTGLLTSSLIAGNDITNGTIDLTSKVTGILPIANGGTNSSTVLNNNRLMISSAGSIVEETAMTDGQLIVGKTGAAPQLVPMSGEATINNTGVLSLSTTGVATGTYGSGTHVSQFTVDSKGRITFADSVLITGTSPVGSALTNGTIWIGDATNFAQERLLNGDISMTNTGVVTVGRINGATLGSTTANNNNILVADGLKWNSVAMSGDITIDNAGLTSIGNGKVTNVMLAGAITNANLLNSTITIGTTSISLGASQTIIAGLASVTSASFIGALTGNASTATTATNLSGGLGGSIPYQTAVNTTTMLANGLAGQVLTSNGTTLAPSWTTPTNGTVTSVGLSLPSFITVTNSPVTGSGTLTGTLASQGANTVFAAPDGIAGTPSFRTLTATDIPGLDWTKIISGKPTTLAGYGITDAALATHNHTLDGLSNVTIAGKANNDILQWNGTAWVNKTLTGAGIITSETDPIVKAINGIVKSNGTTITAAVAGTDYLAPNVAIVAGANTKITYDTKGLITAGASAVLASADFLNQGTMTTILHGNAAGNPSWSQIINADIDPAAGITDSKLATISTAGKVSNSATTATSSNNNNTIVLRDGTGNFSAGTITANLNGTASTVTTNANLTGMVTSVGNLTTVVTNANLSGPITSVGNVTSVASQTGTGSKFVMDNTPTLITPVLGLATATSINKVTITTPAAGSTLTIADGKTFTSSNTLTLAGTDGSTLNIGGGGVLGTAAFTNAGAYEVPLTFSTGLTRAGNTVTVNTSQNISTLSNLVANGLVKTSGGTGALSIATAGTDFVLPNVAIVAGTNTKITYDTKGLITAGASAVLASADFLNQGTTTTILHGNAAGNPSWSQIINADIDPAAGIVDTKLATISTAGKVSNSATTATSSNNNNTIVLRDGSGGFGAGMITSNLTGNVTGNVSGSAATVTIASQPNITTLANLVSVGTISTGIWNATKIGLAYGGTNSDLSAGGAIGDLLYANAATTFARLADIATGNALISGGVGAAPTWGKIGLASHVSGTLGIANGGTGQITQQAAMNSLAGAVTSGRFLRGDGTNVSMSAIQVADVPTLNQNTTGTALNVTGLVAIVNGGTNNATLGVTNGSVIYTDGTKLMNSVVGTSGQLLRSTGAGAPAWTTATYPNTSGNAGNILVSNGTNFVSTGLTTGTSSLGVDVTMTNANQYYPGPSVSLAAGTWFITGTITVFNSSATAGSATARLWDGTTTFSSSESYLRQTPNVTSISLSGIVTLAATTTIRISAASTQPASTISSSTLNNPVGNNASFINAVRIGQ